MKERLAQLFARHRKRLAALVLAVFVAIVAIEIGSAVPRETTVLLDVGDDHARVRELEITYVEGTEDGPRVRTSRRHYEEGAPSRITDSIDLVPGIYLVELSLVRDDGAVTVREGRFEAPGEGAIAVSWGDR